VVHRAGPGRSPCWPPPRRSRSARLSSWPIFWRRAARRRAVVQRAPSPGAIS